MTPRRPIGLSHGVLQTAFAVAAIAAAVALPVILLSVGGGVLRHEINALQDSGFEIAVSAAGLHGISLAHQRVAQIGALATVAAASPVLSEAVDLYRGNSTPVPLLAEGVIPAAFTATEGAALRGLFPNPLPLGDPSDLSHYANGSYSGPAANRLLVSSPFAQSLGLSVGDSVVLAPTTNRSAGAPFTITGTFGVPPATLGPTAAFAGLLPLSDLQVLTGTAHSPSGQLLDEADTIEVSLQGSAATNPDAVTHAAQEIQDLLPYYGVSPLTDQVRQLQSANSILQGFYLALSSVGLATGLIFLLLVLLRRVDAERRSFGIRRALGEPPFALARLTLRWAVSHSAAGALGGVVAGVTVVGVLSRYATGTVQLAASLAYFDPVTLLLLGTGVVGLGLLAGLGAWGRVLRLSIPEVLR